MINKLRPPTQPKVSASQLKINAYLLYSLFVVTSPTYFLHPSVIVHLHETFIYEAKNSTVETLFPRNFSGSSQ